MITPQIIRSKRKTLSLSINENADLVVRAPYHTSYDEIQKFISEKSVWIENKQRLFWVLCPPKTYSRMHLAIKPNSTPNFISQIALQVRICLARPLGKSNAEAARLKLRSTL